ncbi:MAG TPA: hypothetical protein GX005_09800 [Bacteroidales bacterium]|nr:hypothetical protein [Bacteroidales bacterium]
MPTTEILPSVEQVSKALECWIKNNNLNNSYIGSHTAQKNTEEEILDYSKIPTSMAIVLRKKEVTGIVYNKKTRDIHVYTKRKVYQKELDTEVLTRFYSCALIYATGQINEIGKKIDNAQVASSKIITSQTNTQVYTCGSSISPGSDRSAGTLGALVKDSNGTLYGLTNNHVTGLSNHSEKGLPILAPGVLDVTPISTKPFTIGFHHATLSMNIGTSDNIDTTTNTDAALFLIDNPDAVSSNQQDQFDTPVTVCDPLPGSVVEKVGRTTGHTVGVIIGRVLGTIAITYSVSQYDFSGLVFFDDIWVIHSADESSFSAGGDSGSLIVQTNEDGTKSAVGLLFAGGSDSSSKSGDRTFFIPISSILEKFQVSLVGGHNVPKESSDEQS